MLSQFRHFHEYSLNSLVLFSKHPILYSSKLSDFISRMSHHCSFPCELEILVMQPQVYNFQIWYVKEHLGIGTELGALLSSNNMKAAPE